MRGASSLPAFGSLVVVVLAMPGCDKRGPPQSDPLQPAPSASVMSIAVAMGECEDMVICEKECDAGSSDRCRRMGVSYEFGKTGVERDGVEATRLYEKACGMKNSEGCLSAGRMYEFHHGVDKDDAKAVAFYGRSCDMDNPVGCANLAVMLQNGRGAARDDARAAELFDRACTRGSGLACEKAKALRGASPDSGR